MQSPPDTPVYVFFEEKQSGPFPLRAVREMMGAGSLNASASVWHEGMPDWQPIEQYLAAHPEPARVPVARPLPTKTGPAWAEAQTGAGQAPAEPGALIRPKRRAIGAADIKMGAIGAMVGGLIGMGIWYAILKSFKHSLSLWTGLWLFLGIGTAWRLGTGEDQTGG
jgi:hypothetical protein